MQAYASAQLTPLELESRSTQVPSARLAHSVVETTDVQADRSSNPMAILASLILDGLSERELGLLAGRLLPHLRRPMESPDGGAHAAYTVASLAAELGVSQKTIRCAIARRELAAVKRGARWLISADAVRDWAKPSEASTRRRSRCAPAPKAAGPTLRSVLCAASGNGGRR
jgi:excisionase family DNA binding protein